MTIRIIVNGAQGKMGLLACETLASHPDFELVAQLNREHNLTAAIKETQAQIVIDLTRADCVYNNSLAIIEQGVRPVIGTTGLLPDQIQVLQQRCEAQKLGGLIVPNFSIGAILMMHFSALASQFFSEVEIIESHHQNKQDAPSGTAIKTAEMIAAARRGHKNQLDIHQLLPGARGALHQDVPIHSVRLPGVLARQQVEFGNQGETLSITHNTIDRACFKPGILLACQRVMHLHSLHYGLEFILNH